MISNKVDCLTNISLQPRFTDVRGLPLLANDTVLESAARCVKIIATVKRTK